MPGRSYRAAAPVQNKAYLVTLITGSRSYQFRFPQPAWLAAIALLSLIGVVYLGATAYWVFHDDLLASLMRRQIDMQSAYEDRIGLLRHEIETVTLRARSEEARFGADLQKLTQRQTQMENRTAILLALSERLKSYRVAETKGIDGITVKAAKSSTANETNPLLSGAFGALLPQSSSAYAPLAPALPLSSTVKQRPEAPDLRLSVDVESLNEPSPPSAPSGALIPQAKPEQVADLAGTYDRLDADQMRVLANMLVPASRVAKDIRTAFATAGLAVDEFSAAGPTHGKGKLPRPDHNVGGPFVPLSAATDGSTFTRQVSLVESAIDSSENMRRLLPQIPLRRPLYGTCEVTSGFGPRLDPFFRRAAMHTGVDLLDDYGASVHATARGVVTYAGPNGGYGNMVEVDHGNGLTTRYAHLSAIQVSVDQRVEAGTILGKIGSTGRSTGPHLHYETRIAGEPVDPERFLRAGALLFGPSGEDLISSSERRPAQQAELRDQ